MSVSASAPLLRSTNLAFQDRYVLIVIAVALLFGGGTQQAIWSDAIVELAALPLFASALIRLRFRELSVGRRMALSIVAGMLLLPILQLVPLPPDVWRSLPGRSVVVSSYAAVGTNLPWLPLTLDPTSTWRGLLALIPACAIFLAMLTSGANARRSIVRLILIISGCSIFLDLLQILGGPDSPLRLYDFNSFQAGIGFFANANHNAAFLYCVIPLSIGWMIDSGLERLNWISRICIFLLMAGAVIGLSTTWSRAGLALGFLGSLPTIVILVQQFRGRAKRKLLVSVAAAYFVALLLAVQFGLTPLSKKIENSDVMLDLRWPVAQVTLTAIRAHFPFGAGFGTFSPIYEMYAPREMLLRNSYVNHAHDDWLELLLTGGVPAVLIELAFLCWFFANVRSLWTIRCSSEETVHLALGRAASICVALLLLHSIVDYPLRTLSIEALFAVLCGLMLPNSTISDELPRMREADAPQTSAAIRASDDSWLRVSK